MLVKMQAPPITHGDNANARLSEQTKLAKAVLITVDGRIFVHRDDAKRTANFMIHIGVYAGVNLDGGGSTTMVAEH